MRTAEVIRKTKETDIAISINLDGEGVSRISTGIPFMDHMLTLFAKHPYALEGGGVHRIEFSHCSSLLPQIRCLSFRIPTSWPTLSTIMPAPLTGGAKDL